MSGCTGTSFTTEGTGGRSPAITAEETNPDSADPMMMGSDAANEPADSTLTFEEQSVTGILGSYCYGGVCTDAAGILVPPAEETLPAVPVGADLLLGYGGKGRTAVEDASAFPFGPEDVESYPSGDLLRSGTEAPPFERLAASPDGAGWRMQADLSPGEYVIYVLLKIPGGDAYYSFRVAVEPA